MAELRLGMAGLGAVGVATVRALQEQQEMLTQRAGRKLRLVAVSARNRHGDRGVDLSGYRWHDDPAGLAEAEDVDVVIELMGGAEGAARALVAGALRRGKSVVTANKSLLALHGLELAGLAETTGAQLAFEAAVAGGVPVIKVLREAMAANRITKIRGILNGTCNDILSRMMRENIAFDQALRAAQAAGYAEADPSQDIDGIDPAQKIALLALLAFGKSVDPATIPCTGIRGITHQHVAEARRDGLALKLIATATMIGGDIRLGVQPEKLPEQDPFAALDGPTNAIELHGDLVGTLTLIGPGAGGRATASAVIADLVDIARGGRILPFGVPVVQLGQSCFR